MKYQIEDYFVGDEFGAKGKLEAVAYCNT